MWNHHQQLKDAREDGKDLERKVANTRELLNQETVSSEMLLISFVFVYDSFCLHVQYRSL